MGLGLKECRNFGAQAFGGFRGLKLRAQSFGVYEVGVRGSSGSWLHPAAPPASPLWFPWQLRDQVLRAPCKEIYLNVVFKVQSYCKLGYFDPPGSIKRAWVWRVHPWSGVRRFRPNWGLHDLGAKLWGNTSVFCLLVQYPRGTKG